MRLPFLALVALVAFAAPAVAIGVGGMDYDTKVDGRTLGLDTKDAARASPVAVDVEATLAPVHAKGRGPACQLETNDLRSADCDTGRHSVSSEAPTVSYGYDVDLALLFGEAAAPAPAQTPSVREMMAYSGSIELTVPQLVVAAAAASAASGLLYALWRVVKTGGILALVPLATHLKASELLNDPHRKAIYDLIRGEPGVSTKDVADRLGLAWGTVTHHLLKLEKARFVVSQKFGKYRRYFVNGSGLESKEAVATLKVARTGDVVEYVRAHPGASQKDVSEGMGVSSSTVLWHVKRLIKVGLLEKIRDGKSVRYFVRDGPLGGAAASPAPPMLVTDAKF